MRKTITCLLLAAALPLVSCNVVRPNQKWPMLPEYPRPELKQISRSELIVMIRALPPGGERNRLEDEARSVTDDLVEAWRDTAFWAKRMEAVILEYNRQAEGHNKKVR